LIDKWIRADGSSRQNHAPPAAACQTGVDSSTRGMGGNARSLPFSDEFFDVIVSLDSFCYYGTDDLYLNYLARFVKPGGAIGIGGAGLMQEIDRLIPKHPLTGMIFSKLGTKNFERSQWRQLSTSFLNLNLERILTPLLKSSTI
jgi:ubiquinone/menaquinone biosynthesis C-methylase UbiE